MIYGRINKLVGEWLKCLSPTFTLGCFRGTVVIAWFYYFDDLYFSIYPEGEMPVYSLNCRLKK